jgi:beta-lactamase class A
MHDVRGTKYWILAMAVVVILGGAGLVRLGVRNNEASSHPGAGSSPSPTGPDKAQLAAKARATRVSALNAALKKYAATVPEFSVAVLDKKTGQTYAYRGTETYETASVVKVQVLACLLLTAQKQKRELTSTETALAKRMIRLSDNDATTSLFTKLGKQAAVQSCDNSLGLTATTVNSAWGLTRTTADDQVKLLSQLVSTSSPLTAGSRQIAYNLMSTVDEGQDWGIPAAARTGEKFTVKNGWLPRSTEGNRWIINSVGRITGDSTDVSIAVLSHNHTTMSGGIKVVETVAKMTRQYLKY